MLPRLLVCTALLMLSLAGKAQEITILSEQSKLPVEGAVVHIQYLDSKASVSFITNEKGIVSLPEAGKKAVLSVHHLNFDHFTDTLSQWPRQIVVKEALTQLDEVVVTAQYNPQSASNSLYQVSVINADKIEKLGAVSVNQALAFETNINISQDPALGSTNMSLQGLGGQNVKILLDGVPLSGNTGSSVDLSQLNLANTEKIEIIQGPMAVNYGSNALAGVINIITSKNTKGKPEAQLLLQEETVGGEYGLRKGIHYQQLGLTHSIKDKVALRHTISRNQFGGYQGIFEGRTPEWLPKNTLNLNSRWDLTESRFGNLSYQFTYLNEFIQFDAEPASVFVPLALDEEYKSQRAINAFNFDRKGDKGSLNSQLSYTAYSRSKIQFANDLRTGNKPISGNVDAQDTSYFKTVNLRGSFIRSLKENTYAELGYDVRWDQTEGGRIQTGQKSILDAAVFGTAEYAVSKLSFRPGLRYAYNSRFKSPLIPSLHAKIELNERSRIRLSYARGFRAPSLRELYFEFIDSNHRILGNENLKPESSEHYDISMELTSRSSSVSFIQSARFFYNAIDNLINFGQDESNAQVTTYINIDSFTSTGFNLNSKFRAGKLDGSASLNGLRTRERLNTIETPWSRLRWDAQFSLSSELPKEIKGTLNYRYVGVQNGFILDGNDDIIRTESEPYHWMDATLQKQLGSRIELSIGARNLFDVTRIANSGTTGSVHGSGVSRPVGYGRSYFIKILLKTQKSKQ